MRRPPAEYIVLASLAGSLAFWGWIVAFGTVTVTGSAAIGWIQIAVFLAFGALALWLLMRRRRSGVMLSAIFYGIQVLSATFPSGHRFEFKSLPTITIWLFGEKETPGELNLVALILFLLSIGLWFKYKQARESFTSHGTST